MTTIGRACDEAGGDVQTGPFGSQLHASDYVEDGLPSVMPKNLSDDRISTEDIARVSVEDAERLERYRLAPGDIVYSRRGDVERRALVSDQEAGWLCGTGCLRIRLPPGPLRSRYLFYYLGHPDIRAWVVGHAQGATMPNLNTSILRNLPVAFPPIKEQDEIVSVLAALDDKIELNRKMNRSLEEIAQTLFRAWFVDFEGESDLVESELGPIPRGWEVVPLADEFELTMGQSPPGSTYNETGEGLPFYQGATDFGFRFPALRVFCIEPKKVAERGDTLVSVRAPVGRVNRAAARCCIGRGVAALRHRSGAESYTYFVAKHLEERFERFNAEGTVFGSISKKDFLRIPVLKPPSDLLQRFSEVIEPVDKRVEIASNQSRTLADLRDTLLPKLISGEIRVPEAEEAVEEAV